MFKNFKIFNVLLLSVFFVLPGPVFAINDVSILQTTNFELISSDTSAALTTITAQAGDQATNFDVQLDYIDVTLDNLSSVTFKTTVAGHYLSIAKQSGSDDYTSAPATITDQVTLTGTGATVVVRVRVFQPATTPPATTGGGATSSAGPGENSSPIPGCLLVNNISASVNNGALTSNSREVIVSLSAQNATAVALSEDPSFIGASFKPYRSSLAFTLSAPEGKKTVYARFTNNCSMKTISVSITFSLSAPTVPPPLTRDLRLGSSGSEVTLLQQILAADPSVYPSGLVSGYFGPMTQAAVIQFQLKYGLAQPGDAEYGMVGPITRAKLLEIYYKSLEVVEPMAGDLVKLQCPPNSAVNNPCRTVYYVVSSFQRHVFPNLKTYLSWYPDFSGVKLISADRMASLSLDGNMTYKPGRLVKIDTMPNVYVVSDPNILRKIPSEDLARKLYGDNWASQVEDIPDAFWGDYTLGADMTVTSYN